MSRLSNMPFSIIKRSGRENLYVQFKDSTGHFMPAISTGCKDKASAMAVSFKWLREGIPNKVKRKNAGVIPVELKEVIRSVKGVKEAEYICSQLLKKGLITGFVAVGTQASESVNDFLTRFWDFDTSPYIKERQRRDHSIHKSYVINMKGMSRYWCSFFNNTAIGGLTTESINKFIDNLPSSLSVGTKNLIIQSGAIPLKWAFAKHIVNDDITKGIVYFSKATTQRHILPPNIVSQLFKIEWNNKKVKLGNLLSAITGMRVGEIRALQLCDIGDGCLYVRHSWSNTDKLKTTKTNKERVVELPFPFVIQSLKELAYESPLEITENSYIFWSHENPSIPISNVTLLYGLHNALEKIGMTEADAKQYVFHSWRHFYTTYMKRKLDVKLLQTQTGHSTDAMIEHYSSHEAVGDRNKIVSAELEVFGGMLKEIESV